jgi:hypothetical protein
MFVRLKKVQGKHYAYHVENRRVWGKVKQKVKGYIGRAYFPEKVNSKDFFEFIGKEGDTYDVSLKNAVSDLVKWEMHKHDLKDIEFDSDKFSVSRKGSKVILKLNEGYLYDKTLKDITNFHVVGDDEYFIGKEFAETFVKAGIDVPKELFVKLYGEITKD